MVPYDRLTYIFLFNFENMDIIIIGNGLDLAHNLKSSYTDFIKYVHRTTSEGDTSYLSLLSFLGGSKKKIDESSYSRYFEYKNPLFEKITSFSQSKNWCDIEKLYFNELKQYKGDPKEINKQFYDIKCALIHYLKNNCLLNKPNDKFKEFFSNFRSPYMVLNFNYTKNFVDYLEPNTAIFNIHGEVDSINSIIFGYAAEHTEMRELLNLENNDYLSNIKSIKYKHSLIYSEFIDYMNSYVYSHKKDELWILGHSCGISDKLILRQIFESGRITKINICYYNERDYFDKQVNIRRICSDQFNVDKISNFPTSRKIPQVAGNL